MRRLLLALLLLALPASEALAGGGPETTLVVVNARSPLSRRIANEYVARREIPPAHVLWLPDVPHQGVITLDQFRKTILEPIDRYLEDQGLADSIDLVAYSSGFPYGVDFRSALPPGNPGLVVGGTASLTGVTFLAEDVRAGRPFWRLNANRYFRLVGGGSLPPTPEQAAALAKAEAAMRAGQLAQAAELYGETLAAHPGLAGAWYNYACCLARLGRGDEALAALVRSAEEGFTDPGHAAGDPDLAPLRGRPEFDLVLRRMTPGYLPAHGFRCTQTWNREPGPSGVSGSRYRLAIHLAYTGPFGNTLDEVLAYLRAAASADGTKPDGTVYLCRNQDVRSQSREGFFPHLIEAMGKLGRKVEVLEKGKDGQTGVLPVGKPDVLGAVVGIAGFDFGRSGSRILPGAILEHLTSFGAVMAPSGQTKFSEFLRYGAAGASGTVMEPLSIHFKFPNPMLHAHYAEGCSLAEAFYQNVGGPFQLMIAGDGLARPFATFPKVDVEAPVSPWRGEVKIAARAPEGDTELWVDGRPAASGPEMTLDTTTLDDGWHEIRVVAVARDRIGTRAFRKLKVVVDNHGLAGSARWGGKGEPFAAGTAVLRVEGAKEFEVLSGARVVARSTKDHCEIPLFEVGSGPVALVPRLLFPGGKARRLAPLVLAIEECGAGAAVLDDRPRLPGLRGRAAAAGSERTVVASLFPDEKAGPTLEAQVGAAETIRLEGEFEAPADGTFEFAFRGAGKLTLTIGEHEVLAGADLGVERYAAARLAKGWHPIRLEYVPSDPPRLFAALAGGQVHGPARLRHASRPLAAKQPEVEGLAAGKAVTAGGDGLLLVFKPPLKDVAGLVLTPDPETEGFPTKWIVELPAGPGKWKPVEGVEVLVGPPAKKVPSFVELSFRPLKPGKLRVRPVEGSGAVRKIEALAKEK
ncbi:MAG: tetratricopeptide repeat protein [Planctomycetes bacterium]|jgi:hypothetical protein|nr:tetratricopeptide repeat protein [Planctomycetota bacterium]